jgi:N-acetylglutamate synthase-like GNAT family acetyltransferase
MMPDLTIRPARARDAGAIGTLLERSYGTLLAADYPPEVLCPALPLLSTPRAELLALPSYLVAVKDGMPVAVGGWSRGAPQGSAAAPGVGHVRHVACDPDHLRQGIAGRLMGEVTASARAAGLRLMCCLSTRTAAPFYRSLGFVGESEVELRLRPGLWFPAVEMRLWLA